MKKCVLITGAASGIGLATAREFASHGYDLIITGRREEKLNTIKDELVNKFQVEVQLLSFDVRIDSECAEAVSSIHWPIDILLNIEGVGKLIGFDNGNPQDHTSMKSNERKTFNGLALAIVQSNQKPGEIVVKASSPGLKDAQVIIRTVKNPTSIEKY